jgi:hypothetical protein
MNLAIAISMARRINDAASASLAPAAVKPRPNTSRNARSYRTYLCALFISGPTARPLTWENLVRVKATRGGPHRR